MEEYTINDAEAVLVAGRDNLSQSCVGSFFFAETAEQDFCEVMSNESFSERDMRPPPFTKTTINSHEKSHE